MASEQVDRTVATPEPETLAVAEPDLGSPNIPAGATDAQTRLAGATRPASAVLKPVAGVMTAAHASVTLARRGADNVASRLPRTFRATRAGAHDATSALQTLPDPTLRSLAASSVGLGAGFYLAGAPRLLIVAGVVPAMVIGAAIALRPIEPRVPNETDR